MIALLRGTVAASAPGEVVLDVSGVGYRVRIVPGDGAAACGDERTLHTHLVVREDALDLYGFPTPAARDLFTTLLSVTGVGPKLALAALGALGDDGLRRAVVTEDVAALTVVPGVGRKGAQRMILELRERLGPLGDAAPAGRGAANGSDPVSEARAALAALGYAPAEVARALDAVPAEAAGEGPEALVRGALRALGGVAAAR